MRAPAAAALRALLVLAAAPPLRAEVVQLEQVPVPELGSLRLLHWFYVYSESEAPNRDHGPATLEWRAKIHSETSASSEGVQLSLLPYHRFWRLLVPDRFCASEKNHAGFVRRGDLMLRQPASHVYFAELGQGEKQQERSVLTQTGVYVLVLSNCGTAANGTITGFVSVKNPHGFLPGNEFFKMSFYGVLTVLYIVIIALWAAKALWWWQQLFHIHHCISLVAALGLAEALAWWAFSDDWNRKGVQLDSLLRAAILSSVAKHTCSLMLVLVVSMGWGVTRLQLGMGAMLRIQITFFLYAVMDFIWGSVDFFRPSLSIPQTVVYMLLVPVCLLNVAILGWICISMSSLLQMLQERGEAEKLTVFRRLRICLAAALNLGMFAFPFQFVEIPQWQGERIMWPLQFFCAEGTVHLVFLSVLAFLMHAWAPHARSSSYVYSAGLGERDVAEELDDGAGAASGVAPAAIGAAQEEPSDGGAPSDGDDV